MEREYRRERKNQSYQKRKEIPEFGGHEPAYGWTIRVMQYFEGEGTPEHKKLPEMVNALRGRAFTWYQWWKRHNLEVTWWTLMKAVVKEFQPEYDFDQPVWVRDEKRDLKGRNDNHNREHCR